MAKRSTTEKKKEDPVIALKDEVARIALEGALRALVAAQPGPGQREQGSEEDLARERDRVAIAVAYVEIAERARNLDEPF